MAADNPNRRVPPSSEEAERGVLGSILLDANRVIDVAVDRGVTTESFYVQWHRVLFENMIAMHRANASIDLLTVSQWLRDRSILDQAGGNAYIEKLVDSTPTDAHAEYYIEIVLEKELLRGIIQRALETVESCYAAEDCAESLRAKAEYEMARLQQKRTEVEKPIDILNRQVESWRLARNHGCAGTQTGFRFLDLYFGGLMECALYIVSGPPGRGKTTLARNIVENIVMRGIPAGIFTLEQTADQIWGATAARKSKQSMFFLNSGSNKADPEKVQEVVEEVSQWPMYVDDRPQTLTTLFSAARRMVGKHKCKLIVIDYIQRLREEKRYENDTSKVSDYSLKVADMAKELRIPVLIISSESDDGKLRNTRQLNYDAWAHIRVDRADGWTTSNLKHKVTFEKQRFGPLVTDEFLMLIGDEQRFEEPDPDGNFRK